MNETLDRIKTNKLIAIIREGRKDQALNAAYACIEGGMKVVEITMNTPGADEAIQSLHKQFPNILLGAGTILDIETAKLAIDSGAKFLVSPHIDEEIINYSHQQNIPICPGTTTPTEMMTAHKLGARMIKVFPIQNLGGPSYIRVVRGPLPHLNLVPTGGVDTRNVKEYLDAGVFALGLSRGLFPKEAIEKEDFAVITRLTREIITTANLI